MVTDISTIKLSKHYVNKCTLFAEERLGASKQLYSFRGESNLDKMKEDIIVGTLGEWAAYKYLKEKGIEVSKPDMKIYENKRKSFAADLLCESYKFHVKSQSIVSANRYGYSWLCQKTDRLLNKPGDNEYFIFTGVDVPTVEILAIVKVQDIIDNKLIGTPKVWRYQHTKHALYLDDIKNSKIKLWRF